MGRFKKLHWFGIFFMVYLLTVMKLPSLAASSNPASQEAMSQFFPLYQEVQGEVYSIGATLLSPFKHITKFHEYTGEIELSTLSNDFDYLGHLDQSLKLLESVFIFKNEAMIKFLGHDKRVTNYDPDTNLLKVHYFLKGREKGYKEFPYAQNAVDSDTMLVFLQGQLFKEIGNFSVAVIQKAKGLRFNAVFKLTLTDDLQAISPQYKLPERFKARAKQPREVYVYVMELTGLTGLLYQHKFYFAFQKELPYQIIAYWGGAPKEEEFGYVLE